MRTREPLVPPMLAAAVAWWLPAGAHAQTGTGNKAAIAPMTNILTPAPYISTGLMPVNDKRIYIHGIFNELEDRTNGPDNSLRWEGQGWAGNDFNKLWVKTEGQTFRNLRVEDGRDELLYDRPLTTFFDLQAGFRYDLDSAPGRGWAALGIQALLPYYFDLEATAYASDEGHFAARFETFYDILLTNRLILQPLVEINLYSKEDARRGIGSGLSDLDSGLRLRYEFTRKFAPYIGVTYQQRFGASAGFAQREGEAAQDLRFAFGLRVWF